MSIKRKEGKAGKEGKAKKLKKFDCPENANRDDIVTWQTLMCLSKDHFLVIKPDQTTSAFR